jgi:PTS system nitrogen regulatory IIA component
MQLDVRDAAGLLNVSEKTIYRWVKQKKIPLYKINDQYRFNRSELLEWATGQQIPVSVRIMQDENHPADALTPLSEVLKTGGIHYRVGGTDKPSVLHSVVELLRLPPEVDRAFLCQVLLARESLGSTGFGNGIAIPHIRNPIVLHIPNPMISLCFLENPIDFEALDGKPVQALFTIVSPTTRAHLSLLSRLAFALRLPEFAAAIARQASREEILAATVQAETSMQKPPVSGDGI